MIAANDANLSDGEKLLLGLDSVYPKIDNDVSSQYSAALDFLNGWRDDLTTSGNGDRKDAGETLPIIDFDKDAISIYTSFYQQYGINLRKEQLHWYEFMPLLMKLSQDTPMGFIMYIRSCDTKNMSKNEKQRILDLKAQYSLKPKQHYNAKALRDAYLKKGKK